MASTGKDFGKGLYAGLQRSENSFGQWLFQIPVQSRRRLYEDADRTDRLLELRER